MIGRRLSDLSRHPYLGVVGQWRRAINSGSGLHNHETSGLLVSAISCWEVAKLVEVGRLKLSLPTRDWISQALGYAGIQLVHLTPEIAVESTDLPGMFHRDPADQIIVATARILDVPLLTADAKVLSYAHVKKP